MHACRGVEMDISVVSTGIRSLTFQRFITIITKCWTNMGSSSAVRDALQEIARRTDDDMSERDVENLFLETGFYDGLGYEGTGIDIRSEFTLPP